MTLAAESSQAATVVKAPRVFLSHASADREFVESIRETLESSGYPCWVAYRDVLKANEEIYAGQIMAALEACPDFVVVLSQAALDSPHVYREVERAVSERRRIVSIRHEPVELKGGWEYLLASVQWIDAFGRPARDVGRELAGCLKASRPPWMPRPGLVWLGLAVPVLMLLLALFLRLQPPWPEPLVAALFSLAALVAPAVGARLFMPQLEAPHWLKPALAVTLICLLVYAIGWSTCIYEARERRADDSRLRPIPKLIGGFLLQDDAWQLMRGPDRDVGLTDQKALENASFDPEQVWKPWTVRLCQAVLLLSWVGLFAGVGLGLAASGIHARRRSD
jgi:hypothetical protein